MILIVICIHILDRYHWIIDSGFKSLSFIHNMIVVEILEVKNCARSLKTSHRSCHYANKHMAILLVNARSLHGGFSYFTGPRFAARVVCVKLYSWMCFFGALVLRLSFISSKCLASFVCICQCACIFCRCLLIVLSPRLP